MALEKARVQLIDPDTGLLIAEVDVLTSAQHVAYETNRTMVKDFRGIPAGTTFNETDDKSVKDVLDDILFPYIEPKILYITDNNDHHVTEDHIEYIERFKELRPYYLTAQIEVGSADTITITLKRYNGETSQTITEDTTVKVEPGSSYIYQVEIEKMSYDTAIQVVVSDGRAVVNSPIIQYKFIYPVFVGFCNLEELLTSDGVEIDSEKASDYFNTLIRNESPLLDERLCPLQNQQGISIHKTLYRDLMMNPCILYPNTWSKCLSITDVNDDNIIGSFYYNTMVPIKTDSSVTSQVQYTAFINKNVYSVELAAVEQIWYNFLPDKGSLDHVEEGVPSLTGFDVLCKLPVDLRTVVDEYMDLIEMKYPYDSLVTYVKKERTFFKYIAEEDRWVPCNNQIFLSNEKDETPPLDLGGWDDIYINLRSGVFYKKDQNNEWKAIGRLSGSGGGSTTPGEGTTYPEFDNTKTYQAGIIVKYDGKYWYAKVETNSTPGTDDTWEETTIGGGSGEAGPQGPPGIPGDAATIEIVDVITGLPGSKANVENIGDKQNARLVFTIPQGPKATLDGSLSVEGDAADAKKTGEELAKKVPFPTKTVDDETIIDYGKSGDILVSNGDGTFKWSSFQNMFEKAVKVAVERGIITVNP